MFERTFALLRDNPKLFFGIAAVLFGVEIVIGGVLGGSGLWMMRSSVGTVAMTRMLVTFPLALLGGLMIYVFTQIIQGALFLATQARLAKTPMTVGEACRLAADKIGRLVGISILVALRMFGYMLLLYFGLAIVGVIVALMFGGFAHLAGNLRINPGVAHGPAQLLGAGALVLFFLLALGVLYILALLWLFARYAIAIPSALAENASVTEAIRRSIHLTRGSKGRLYALFLAVFGVYILIAAVALPVQMMILHATAHRVAAAPLTALLMLLPIFENLVGVVVITFVGIATALCYFDLRVRKEGFGADVPTPVIEIPAAAPPLPNNWPIEDAPIS